MLRFSEIPCFILESPCYVHPEWDICYPSTIPSNSLQEMNLANQSGVRHNASSCWCWSRKVRVGVFLCCWKDFRCKQLLLSVALNTFWVCLDEINPRSVAPTKGRRMFEVNFFFSSAIYVPALYVMRHYVLIKCIQIKCFMKKACRQRYNYPEW